MRLSASIDVSMKFQEHVEERESQFPQLKFSNIMIFSHPINSESEHLSLNFFSAIFYCGSYKRLCSG